MEVAVADADKHPHSNRNDDGSDLVYGAMSVLRASEK